MHEVNQSELSKIIGLSTRQISNLEAHGIPHRAEGRHKLYPIPDAVQWYVRWKADEARSQMEATDFEEAKARRETARARLAEIEVAKAERRVLDIGTVEEIYGTRLLDVLRSGLLNMPGRWGAQIVGLESPREGEAVLTDVAHELLEEFSGAGADALESGDETLPEDCPERDVLEAAGVTTMAELLSVDDLTELSGIGPARSSRILTWLEGAEGAA